MIRPIATHSDYITFFRLNIWRKNPRVTTLGAFPHKFVAANV